MKNPIFRIFIIIIMTSSISMYCYGSFPITRAIYQFNNTAITQKPPMGTVFKSILMLILIYPIPVYEIAALGDIILFNTIEFWQGKKIDLHQKNSSLLRIQQEGEKLKIDSPKSSLVFYVFRDKPNKLFLYKKGKWIPVEITIQDRYLYLKDKNHNTILMNKQLSHEENRILNHTIASYMDLK